MHTKQLLVLLAFGLLGTSQAVPQLWIMRHANGDCQAIPQVGQQWPPHGPVAEDSAITFAVTDANGTVPDALCPGQEYNVTVQWSDPRGYLLIVTDGTINANESAPNYCPQRIYGGGQTSKFPSVNTTLLVPCTPNSDSITMKVATSPGPPQPHYVKNSDPFTINPACAVPACAAPPSPPGATPSASPSPAPTPARTPGGASATQMMSAVVAVFAAVAVAISTFAF